VAGIKDLVKDSSIYGLGSALQKFIGVLLIPIYTRVLTPADYGILSSLTTLGFFLSVIFDLGFTGAAGRYFFFAENDREKGKVLFTSLAVKVFTSILVLVIFLPLARRISIIMFKSDIYADVVFVSLLLLPVTNVSSLQDSIFRLFRQPLKYTIVTVLRSLLYPSLGIFFVVVLRKGVLGVQLASLIGTTFMMIFSFFFFIRKKYTWSFDKIWAKRMFIFGFPLIWYGIAQWFFSVSDRFFLLHYSDLKSIGYYSIGFTFSQPIDMLNTAIEMGAGVLILKTYHSEADPEKPRTKSQSVSYWNMYLLISVPIAAFISIFGKEILSVVTTKAYIPGALAIPFLAFSSIVMMNNSLTGFGMNIKEKTRPMSYMMIFCAVLNVAMNFYFIPKFGFVGAAFTTLFCTVVFWFLAHKGSQRYFYIKRKIVPALLYQGCAFSIALVVPVIQIYYNIHINIFILVALFLFTLTIPFLVGLFSFHQAGEIMMEAKSIINKRIGNFKSSSHKTD